jgi:hypothetical protein
MTGYIGIKRVEAKPMNLSDYNAYKGWTIPENEDTATEGYLVQERLTSNPTARFACLKFS